MLKTHNPKTTILFYVKNAQLFATVKVNADGSLHMQEVKDPDNFANTILNGDKGICFNTDNTVTYFSVDKDVHQWSGDSQRDNILSIQETKAYHQFCF